MDTYTHYLTILSASLIGHFFLPGKLSLLDSNSFHLHPRENQDHLFELDRLPIRSYYTLHTAILRQA